MRNLCFCIILYSCSSCSPALWQKAEVDLLKTAEDIIQTEEQIIQPQPINQSRK